MIRTGRLELRPSEGDMIWVGYHDGHPVVEVGRHNIVDEFGFVNIWYRAIDEGRGYATEAVHGFLIWLQKNGIIFVTAEVEAGNIKSKKVLAKNGFHKIGVHGMDVFLKQINF